jgi:hypothetical protein
VPPDGSHESFNFRIAAIAEQIGAVNRFQCASAT